MTLAQTIMLPVDAIHVGDRQRTNDEATEKHIVELARDIQQNGLIHAPLVDKNNDLVAGYCRLSAIKRIGVEYYYAGAVVAPGFVPVTISHMDDERDIFRVELMENLRRKSLSPLDEAKAISQLHKFQLAQRGPGWTKEDTGKELDMLRGNTPRSTANQIAEVSDSLLIAPFEDDLEVQKAGSRKEAVKIVRKKMEQGLTALLGEFVKKKKTKHELYEGDCRVILPTLPAESFAGIVTDPPYGIDADAFGDQAMKTGHNYADTKELALSVASAILIEGFRVCQPSAHLYMFCDPSFFYELKDKASSVGWQVFATPLIWHKPNIGHAPWPGYFGRRYECILFAQKGTRRLQRSRSDVFEFAAETNKLHAAQKPTALIEELLALSFLPGECVLDPCAGSGTIYKAAKATSITATGIECVPQSIGFCQVAMQEE